jgi:hypothetical protein
LAGGAKYGKVRVDKDAAFQEKADKDQRALCAAKKSPLTAESPRKTPTGMDKFPLKKEAWKRSGYSWRYQRFVPTNDATCPDNKTCGFPPTIRRKATGCVNCAAMGYDVSRYKYRRVLGSGKYYANPAQGLHATIHHPRRVAESKKTTEKSHRRRRRRTSRPPMKIATATSQ